MVDNINIIEYSPEWAKSLAKMWNQSADSWGGSGVVHTEESVHDENENSTNKNIYLAIVDQEVVGYCSFSEYREDEGAMYIPLLNVRPDYHGMKVGKALVLKAVDRTIELGWPRLDLYTWPGNTKAVPAYKKCGFFWEKREDATHLMNFIPTVLSTEAVVPFFQYADWYEDSKRPIEVIPDGRCETGLEIFEYAWEKDSKHLKMEFERSGRGLRLIETDEYRIKLILRDKDFVFGRNYPVVFELTNKVKKPLNITIQGKNDKNIEFAMRQTITVQDYAAVEGTFYVGDIVEEQSHWKTHPGVLADITINGLHASFKIGIEPKFPAKMSFSVPEHALIPGCVFNMYLELENNFNESAAFSFELPDTQIVSFAQNEFKIFLDPHQRQAVLIRCTLHLNAFFEVNLLVKAAFASGEKIIFEKRLTAAFRGDQGLFSGETDWSYMVASGGYTVNVNKHNNDIGIGHLTGDEFGSFLMCPKLGLPFSLEFTKKRPIEVTYTQFCEGMELRARYQSDQHSGIELSSCIRLSLNGLIEHYYEAINTGTEDKDQDLFIQRGVFHDLFRAILPYEHTFVGMNASPGGSYSLWDSSKVTENWIYARSDTMTRGLCWDPEDKPKFNEWHMVFEHNFGRLKVGEVGRTRSIMLALGTFSDWKAFRAYARKVPIDQALVVEDIFSVQVNDGNPFIHERFDVRLKSFLQQSFEGSTRLSSGTGYFPDVVHDFLDEENVRETKLTGVEIPTAMGQDILSIHVDLESMGLSRKALVFYQSGGEVGVSEAQEAGMPVWIAENETIEIRASSGYAPALYSIKYKGSEWLDSTFPQQPGPKSWWNPWLGGIITQPQEITNLSLMKEGSCMKPAQLKDNHGNLWRGIQIRTEIKENEKLKGLTLIQYYLMLPGVPVVWCTTEIRQNTGTYFNNKPFMTMAFIKPNEEIKQSRYQVKNRDGSVIAYKAGRVRQDIKADGPVLYLSDARKEKLLVVNNPEQSFMEAMDNNQVMGSILVSKVSAKDGDRVFLPPMFLIFTEAYMEASLLKDLMGIRF